MDNQQCSDEKLRELALFAGGGGGVLGGKLLGWETVCGVEIDPYAASVLVARQNDGILSPFPIWDDICSFDGRPWRGRVDVVSGGFPCQDISPANTNAVGIKGAKSGLWKQMRRIIYEVRPEFAFVENSRFLTKRGIDVVLGDLAEIGYNARWGVFSGAEIGAEHIRERLFILAYTNQTQLKRGELPSGKDEKYTDTWNPRWGKDKPGVDRMAYGMAAQVDRLNAIGNGQIPSVVRKAWMTLLP